MTEVNNKNAGLKSVVVVRKNIAANMIGSAWVALLSIAFVPLYIHFLGVEAYGLIGFFVTLQVLFSVLDMGLTATLSRELARLSVAGQDAAQQMRDVVRTLEAIYWGLAIIIIFVVFALAEWIATGWLNVDQLQPDVVSRSVMLMGVVIAFRMPYGFYSGGLIGLQNQVLLNRIKVVVETVRNGGGVLVLWLFSPSITAFFSWHAIAGCFSVIVLAVTLWKVLPATGCRAMCSFAILRQLWRFGAAMSMLTVLGLLVVELDKVILSKMLPLEEFGYYMLASTLAMGINLIIVPVFTAMHPRLTQLLEAHDEKEARRLYHKGSQVMAVLVMPVAITLCFYAEPILTIWTQNAEVARLSSPLLSILVIGTALNSIMNMPYALQIAHGWIKLSIISNIVAVIVLVPCLVWGISHYGVVGAASIWLALNAGYVLINSPIIHWKLLRGEFHSWLLVDNLVPIISVLLVVFLSWKLMPVGMDVLSLAIWIFSSFMVSFLLAAILLPVTRSFMLAAASAQRS